jgi:hypothetical protein
MNEQGAPQEQEEGQQELSAAGNPPAIVPCISACNSQDAHLDFSQHNDVAIFHNGFP